MAKWRYSDVGNSSNGIINLEFDKKNSQNAS